MTEMTSRQDQSGAIVVEKKETDLKFTMRVLENLLPTNHPDKKELQQRLNYGKERK